MTPKIERFLAERQPQTPCLVVDLDVIAGNFRHWRATLPSVRVAYAVKANPATEVVQMLDNLGSCFDAASIYEIDACLALGIAPDRIHYGSTVKKKADIARAHDLGVRVFAFDSDAELAKLAEAAPGAGVYCRIAVPTEGADWPLARKFGCSLESAHALMLEARERGLDASGISFHVGSQQTIADQWRVAIERAAFVIHGLAADGLTVRSLNLGGGFPIRYRNDVASLEEIAAVIDAAMAEHLGDMTLDLIAEPGRSIVGTAGAIESEVVLISDKRFIDGRRWVYLDVGKFGGLSETIDECIQYEIVVPEREGEVGPVVLAGPTCDSADIMYETARYDLPADLRVGDKVRLLNTAAYTTTYASTGFNGFPPLVEYYI